MVEGQHLVEQHQVQVFEALLVGGVEAQRRLAIGYVVV